MLAVLTHFAVTACGLACHHAQLGHACVVIEEQFPLLPLVSVLLLSLDHTLSDSFWFHFAAPSPPPHSLTHSHSPSLFFPPWFCK